MTRILISLVLLAPLAANAATVTVQTPLGQVMGATNASFSGHDFLAFQGIPYGQPPTGARRFGLPVPVQPWDGVLDATSTPDDHVCPQGYNYDVNVPHPRASEDCLYLNVYRKGKSEADLQGTRMPVMVWIHGGSNTVRRF